MSLLQDPSRRKFVVGTAALGTAVGSAFWISMARAHRSAAIIGSEHMRPRVSHGIQFGDPYSDRAIVWARSDRPARMLVEWSLHPSFRRGRLIRGPHALPNSDFCTRLDLQHLPAGQDIFVRVRYESLDSDKIAGEPVIGQFRSAPRRRQSIRFVWGGDTGGQGWGIDLNFGGMLTYRAMEMVEPDFFIHCGDTIYADGPMQNEVALPDHQLWRNAYLDLEPAKMKVAETLEEFRACYRYNLLDEHLRSFNQKVPQIWQWDDHEVVNNFSDAKDLSGDPRYSEKRVQLLAARGGRAFREYAPMRPFSAKESERVYRKIAYGPDLDLFVIDMRSYRGRNSYNRQNKPGEDTALLGREQLYWLKRELKRSQATWKIISSDMPLALLVRDGQDLQNRPRFEAVANGDGPVLGREFEIANLLAFLKRKRVNNVVWLTADVHYCAAHYYDPRRAVFSDFQPFWEFVAGPLHAGTFGPNELDNTFGPQVVFQQAPLEAESNLPPSAGMQFFGQVDIDHQTKELTIAFKNRVGQELYTQTLGPEDDR